MSAKSEKGIPARSIAIGAIVLAIVATALAGYTFYYTSTQIASIRQPKVQKITIIMGEGEIIQEVGGEETLTGEFHRWEPPVIVVNKGDTVELTVKNPRSHAHSFVLAALGVDTGRIPGRSEKPSEADRTVVKTFIADKAGVFQFVCGMPFDHSAGNCDPDHARMVGNLIVLE